MSAAKRPSGALVGIGQVLVTAELGRRPSRAPDHAAENRVLAALVTEMATRPGATLQTLANAVLGLCRAGSAGISILEPGGEAGVFRRHAAAGAFAHLAGSTVPREASPCGAALAGNSVLLLDRPERCFPALQGIGPPIFESLLAPFHVGGEPAGAVWAMAHDPERRFDAEDARVLDSLACFAAAACQTSAALDAAELGRRELEARAEQLANVGKARGEDEARFRNTLEIGTVGVIFFESAGTITDANDAFLRMGGYNREDLSMGRLRWEKLTPPEWMPASLRAIEEIKTRGSTTPYEKQYYRKDGSRWWGLFAAKALGESGGVEFILDITDAKRAEAALRDSEARQAFLLKLSDALRSLADPAAIEGEACRLLGERLDVDRAYYVEVDEAAGTARIERDFVRGDAPSLAGAHRVADFAWSVAILRRGECHVIDDTQSSELVPPADRPASAALGIVACMGAPLIKGDGLAGALCVTASRPRTWTKNEVELLCDVGERIWAAVERARAEARLRESEARFRQFADASSDVLWIRDADTLRFEYVGPAFEAIYGESFERVFAGNDLKRWAELIVPEDRKRVLGNLRRVRRGERVTHEFRIRRPADGALRWIGNTDFALLDEQGRVRHVAGIGQDVTAAKQAEAGLRELNATLEARVEARTAELMAVEATLRHSQKMEAVGQLTGGIAHDFNNMLQGIAGSLELMRRRAEQGRLAESGRFVESARETVRRAAALTHRLLAFARQQTLAPVLVNLDELVMGMAELIRRTVGPAIQVEVRLGDGAWPVLCDESQLENALLNLCVNARDAMPDGGWLTITTEEVPLSEADLAGEAGIAPGVYAAVAVTDVGAGMDKATQARVFEPFFTTKPLGQGTGLGLSQVYGFVRQSGGLVRIESAPGQGTTVRLLLPRHETAGAASARDGEVASAVVLLVEDEAGLREMAAEWLREAGHRVLEAPDGAAALRLLQGGGRVDALVTDVGLPGGMNGRQVADAARAQRPGLPVLFMTGYAGEVLGGQLARGMEVLGKPFELAALAERVQAMLDAVAAP